jgi:hypothetical protein
MIVIGSEAWSIGEVDQKRLEAFEIWCWKRMLKTKWTGEIRNEEVYRKTKKGPFETPQRKEEPDGLATP